MLTHGKIYAGSDGLKQLPAFFKFQVAGQRQNMKSAQILPQHVVGNLERHAKNDTDKRHIRKNPISIL